MRLYFVHQALSVKRSTTICVPFGRSFATSRLPQPFHGIFADCFIYFCGKKKQDVQSNTTSPRPLEKP